MDYEKKYEELVGKIEKAYLYAQTDSTKAVLEEIRPELKSEDERIRRFLHHTFTAQYLCKDKSFTAQYLCKDKLGKWHGEPVVNILAWLEKQGEQKNSVVDFKAKDWYVSKVDGKIHNIYEPKFKVGGWIISKYMHLVMQILNNDNWSYKTVETDGTERNDSYDFIERNFKLWTIADAKDGDVLVDKSNNRESPFLFKETKPSNIKTDCLNPLTILGYCGIGGAGFTKSEGWGDTANCTYYPATKEQRDLLFLKMKEAGYEWNADKKELERIIDEKQIKKNLQDNSFRRMFEQKPNWSEEDEEISKGILNYLCLHDACELEGFDSWYNWLKSSLKDKVQSLSQPKEWSEEDEKMLFGAKFAVEEFYREKKGKVFNWLDQLKERFVK